jgi:hypothetical protein
VLRQGLVTADIREHDLIEQLGGFLVDKVIGRRFRRCRQIGQIGGFSRGGLAGAYIPAHSEHGLEVHRRFALIGPGREVVGRHRLQVGGDDLVFHGGTPACGLGREVGTLIDGLIPGIRIRLLLGLAPPEQASFLSRGRRFFGDWRRERIGGVVVIDAALPFGMPGITRMRVETLFVAPTQRLLLHCPAP